MVSPRAPLFSVSIAFATGCVLGLDGWIPLSLALPVWLLAGVIWFLCRRREWPALIAFFGFVIASGLVHTLSMAASIPPYDLRRLPEEKTFESTQWRGVIEQDPTVHVRAHIRSKPLSAFVVDVQAWRPTGGRLFDAPIDRPWQRAQGKISCRLSSLTIELHGGDQIEFAAPLGPVPSSLNPGELDQKSWDAQQGIYDQATIENNQVRLIRPAQSVWEDFSSDAREWAYDRLKLGLEDDSDTADFLAGMLIGYRQEIPAGIEQNFRRTGTMHVFAVSGQNVAVMLLVVMTILQLAGLVRWRWGWILAPLVLAYCVMTGSPASAIRATVMALFLLFAWRLNRPLHALSCWSLALLAMLVWNPSLLVDPGAQLSFGVVLGLILFSAPLANGSVRFFQPDPFLPQELWTVAQQREEKGWRWLCALLASGVAATVISEPITAVDFHQITPIAILANLVVLPTAGLITIIGTISIVASLLSPWLASLCNNANWLVAKVLIAFVSFLAHEPGAGINVADYRTQFMPTPSFVVMAAQGSASVLVRTADGAWLVNAGKASAAPSSVWRMLQFHGINRLDGLVLADISAPDNGGTPMIVRDFRPRHLIMPILPTRSPLDKTLIEEFGDRIETWQEGSTVPLGSGVTVEILHPSPDSPEKHANDRALVLLFHAGGQTLLWADDIGSEAQAEILSHHPGLHADVLVMGTNPWPDETWLRALQPRHWLQMPSVANPVQTNGTVSALPDFPVWPLDQTGAVEVHFVPAQNGKLPEILLRPWRELPGMEEQAAGSGGQTAVGGNDADE